MKTILRIIFIFILIAIAILLAIPIFSITELLYPEKVDSVYVRAEQSAYEKQLANGKAKPGKIFLYNPRQLHLNSEDFFIRTDDHLILKGWFITGSDLKSDKVLILIPDLTESKLNYIEAASEFAALGINVCLMDMRAQGESDGTFYTMGKRSVRDISIVADSLISKYQPEHISIMGIGTGAAIALQAAITEDSIKLMVLQNPFPDFETYLEKYAEEKYGRFSQLFFGRMKKNLEKKTGFPADSLNLSKLVQQSEQPSLFISYLSKNNPVYESSEKLYEASTAIKKQRLVFRLNDEDELNLMQKKKYYDSIAAFINSNIPKKKKKSKFRKLVFK